MIAAVSMGIVACKKPPTKSKSEVIQERLDERLLRWREGMNRNCLQKVMDAASIIADSTLLANARFERDTMDFPAIPGRPNRPDFIPPKDTVAIKPIFDRKNKRDTTN